MHAACGFLSANFLILSLSSAFRSAVRIRLIRNSYTAVFGTAVQDSPVVELYILHYRKHTMYDFELMLSNRTIIVSSSPLSRLETVLCSTQVHSQSRAPLRSGC